MKKAIVNMKINVPDNFYPGDCMHCPFVAILTHEPYSGFCQERHKCKLNMNKVTCPIEV